MKTNFKRILASVIGFQEKLGYQAIIFKGRTYCDVVHFNHRPRGQMQVSTEAPTLTESVETTSLVRRKSKYQVPAKQRLVLPAPCCTLQEGIIPESGGREAATQFLAVVQPSCSKWSGSRNAISCCCPTWLLKCVFGRFADQPSDGVVLFPLQACASAVGKCLIVWCDVGPDSPFRGLFEVF